MPMIKWNLCTSFAAAGTAIAYAFLFLLFGFHWQYVPAAIVGIVAAYGAGTALGELATRVQLGRYRVAGVIAGVGIAWCTLFAGTLAIALTTFAVATIDGLVAAPSGQPFTNVLAEIAPRLAKDLLKTPLVAGVLFGLVPAALLGIVYGFVLTRRFDGSATVIAANRAWVRGAAAVTLLLPLALFVALIGVPGGGSGYADTYSNVPIAVRGCNSYETAAGAEAVCYGAPCVDGVCDWDKE
ncbi:MAG: hypothetical protein HKN59_03625, partial [Gammaproteobacteria bacterium]|nr:hypothetical protein [Gammaproteobacteria bacterium]